MYGHSADKYINGFMAQTSNARGWSSLLAERWNHAAGELPALIPRETEIAVLLRGRAVVDRAGGGQRQHTRGGKGTIWLCPAGVEEEYVNVVEPIDDCLHLFLPEVPFSNTLLREFDIDLDCVQLRYECIASDPFIEHVADQVARELSRESASGGLLIEMLGVALAAHLLHGYSSAHGRARPSSTSNRPLDARRLARVLDFVTNHLDQEFTVADLASIACTSVAHFARGFRAATGTSPHAYVSAQRLDRAKQRLLTEDCSISDIAMTAGFSSQANFTRAFRTMVGVTPTQFRSGRGSP